MTPELIKLLKAMQMLVDGTFYDADSIVRVCGYDLDTACEISEQIDVLMKMKLTF